MGLLNTPEMKPTPRNQLLGLLADALTMGRDFADKAKVPDVVPLLGGQGLGSLLLGKAPEELTDISYGNMPVRINPLAGRTASFVPEIKPGRKEQVADLAMALQAVPGGNRAALGALGAVDTGANKAAIVWHGSPHKFDKFDASKIGTGEGNQAYGHGLYLAEIPDVAGSYIQAGRNVGFTNFDDPIRLANKAFGNAQGNTQAALKLLDDAISSAKPGSRQNNLIFAKRVIERGDQTASLYKVDLPAPLIARMVDWDQPLYRQAPNVRKAVRQVVEENTAPGTYAQWVRHARPDMRNLQNDMLEGMSNAEIAEALRKQGIPGIRYLDGGSRGAGQGTSNFVVFPGEESALRILERNGGLLAP